MLKTFYQIAKNEKCTIKNKKKIQKQLIKEKEIKVESRKKLKRKNKKIKNLTNNQVTISFRKIIIKN